jgi:hypothetical protein
MFLPTRNFSIIDLFLINKVTALLNLKDEFKEALIIN